MLVVSNTSPLTNLAAIDRFDLLRDLFGEIHIADGVWRELNAGGRPQVGSREVGAADWIHRHPAGNRPLIVALRRDLDLGEAETVALALELKADVVLMDEREGRHAAIRLGLEPLGVLGILLRAKKKGLLAEVRPAVDALRRQAGFYVADQLYREVLMSAEEES
jgi:hypothetical protein